MQANPQTSQRKYPVLSSRIIVNDYFLRLVYHEAVCMNIANADRMIYLLQRNFQYRNKSVRVLLELWHSRNLDRLVPSIAVLSQSLFCFAVPLKSTVFNIIICL